MAPHRGERHWCSSPHAPHELAARFSRSWLGGSRMLANTRIFLAIKSRLGNAVTRLPTRCRMSPSGSRGPEVATHLFKEFSPGKQLRRLQIPFISTFGIDQAPSSSFPPQRVPSGANRTPIRNRAGGTIAAQTCGHGFSIQQKPSWKVVWPASPWQAPVVIIQQGVFARALACPAALGV